jgi:glutamate-5-semialdehyde dehydrogenase
LCLKSSNAVVLRGGSEAVNSNIAIHDAMMKALSGRKDMPRDLAVLIKDTDRRIVDTLLGKSEFIDLVMPRGGESLIREVTRKSTIPVIKHYKGVCHTYVDGSADLKMAEEICYNAKVQRPGVCNAMESMLVDRKAAKKFMPAILKRFMDAGVEIRGCPETARLVEGVRRASKADYCTEYLDLKLSVKVVAGIDEAIRHITKYGSSHSDAIITRDKKKAEEFLRRVDSACVYVNASTRFTDGGQFGKGAEIGISTDKIHARGPMGVEELTSYKYLVYGTGQIRK